MTVNLYTDQVPRQFLLDVPSIPLRLGTRQYTSPDSGTTQEFEGKLLGPLKFSRSLYSGSAAAGDVRLGGATATGDGNLVLATGDGALTSHITDNLDGVAYSILMGLEDDLKASHVQIGGGKLAGFTQWGEMQATLAIQDALQRMQSPALTATYAGTGDLEGGTDAQGKAKPAGFGQVRNATPVLLDSALQIYQFHSGPSGIRSTQALDGVRVNGAASTITTDNANYAALKAAAAGGTIGAGNVQSCLAAGCFAIGSAINGGQVTCDFRGDATGSYVSSAAKILERLLLIWANPVFVAGTDYDSASITALDALNSATVGLYLTDLSTTLAQVADDLIVRTLGGWYLGSRTGLLTVGRLDAPTITAATDAACKASFTKADMVKGSFRFLPLGAPPWRIQANYRRNWTVQKSGLATSLTPAKLQEYGNPSRTTTPLEDATLRAARASSVPLTIETLFDVKADADTEVTRRQALIIVSHGPRRAIGFTAEHAALGFLPGDEIWVAHEDLLPNGAGMRVTAIDEDWIGGQNAVTGFF
jgi:hypothetical protein